jgi:predicted nucleotidyltransferase
MEIGINNYLKRISSELLIKSNSLTGINIFKSLGILDKNLKEHFSNELSFINVFGSYSRGTILPRAFDKNSDIDVLIGFNTKNSKFKPASYRERLLRFAFKYYPSARILKDHPSIVVELNHINFDLVPGIIDNGVFYDSVEIPDKDGGWMETEPAKFNKKLTEANTSHKSIVKPIVRFLKVWNANEGYPYYSYELESAIVDMNFSGDSFASGLLYAIDNLPIYPLPNISAKKIDVLRNNAKWIREYIGREDLLKAKEIVRRIIPVNIE